MYLKRNIYVCISSFSRENNWKLVATVSKVFICTNLDVVLSLVTINSLYVCNGKFVRVFTLVHVHALPRKGSQYFSYYRLQITLPCKDLSKKLSMFITFRD